MNKYIGAFISIYVKCKYFAYILSFIKRQNNGNKTLDLGFATN